MLAKKNQLSSLFENENLFVGRKIVYGNGFYALLVTAANLRRSNLTFSNLLFSDSPAGLVEDFSNSLPFPKSPLLAFERSGIFGNGLRLRLVYFASNRSTEQPNIAKGNFLHCGRENKLLTFLPQRGFTCRPSPTAEPCINKF